MRSGLVSELFYPRVCFWNINGRIHLLRSKFIQNWLHGNFDIVFVSETHLTKNQLFDLNDFAAYHNPYSTVDDAKPRGGVSCFVLPDYLRYIKCVDISSPDHIVVRFKNGDTVFSSYIAPTDSPYFDVTDFSNIANAFSPVDKSRVVFGGGDMNGRVGTMKSSEGLVYRQNVDNVLNDHGKEILKICKAFKCFIINNLNFNEKIFDGDFTFQKGGRKSQNDIILSNRTALQAIQNFKIHKEVWNPSDHCPVSVTFELKVLKDMFGIVASDDLICDLNEECYKKPKKISTKSVNWDSYYRLVESDQQSYAKKVEELKEVKSLENLDALVSDLSKSFYKAAEINTISTRKTTLDCNGGIFDSINDVLSRKEENCNDERWDALREEAIEHIKQDVSETELNSWTEVMQNNDSKALWNKINWKGNLARRDVNEKPGIEDLAAHLSSKGQAGRESTVLCEVTSSDENPILDSSISVEEILSASKKVKEDKSSGDGWVKNMVTNLPASILLILQLIFNTILSCHMFPTQWRMTVINEIFKNKGLSSQSVNYRGISLVQLLAKMFDFIILERFKKWFKPADEQTAYQEKKGGADHVFLLRCMGQFAKKFKKKLFLIAIDFDGAFDRVSRAHLIRKLCLFGAGKIFSACLASIYMCTNNVIFRGTSHVMYKLYSGIKQGLPSSPMLFLFYINDVFNFLGAIYDGAKDIFDIIHILIHADDATIIATCRESAVKKLKSMLEYCNLNYIIPQFTKCEFIVVNGDQEDHMPLPFGDHVLPNVDHIVLLGSHLSESASLKVEMEMHMKKRYKSVIKFYNFMRSNKLAPLKVKLKVLKACVGNSLLYNCETFGASMPKDLEPTYIKLLKCCLGVRSNTPNDIVYIESGFLPIKAVALMRQLKFYERFFDTVEKNSRRDKMLKFLTEEENRTAYIQYYEDLSMKYSSKEDIVREFREQLRERIRHKANSGHYKYTIYTRINPDLNPSHLINSLHPTSLLMVRFRLGSHNFPIETGRWIRRPRPERLCGACGELGDEEHVLFRCSLVRRDDLSVEGNLSEIWDKPDTFELFKRIKSANFL